MKKRKRSRGIFKIFIFIAVCMMIITALLPKAAVAESVKTVKSSKAVTDVKIIYDASYRTADYTCWSGGYSSWTGTAYNNLNTVKNAGVVRRGTTFTFTGTGATASTVIEVRGPTDSGSRPVITGWSPTYAGGENWQLTIPKDASVGDYQIYMDSEYCTLYVIFDVFLTKNPSGMTDNQFAGWAYDESSTADNYIPVLDNTNVATLNPFTERATEMAVSVLGGNTTTSYEAGIKMYRVTNSRITWDGGATVPSLTEMLNQATALPVWEAKNVSLQTGYTLPSGMVLATGYQCTHFAYVTAGLARSLGIPSRGIHCKTIWEWNYHEWAELYIDDPGATLAGDDSKWLVFDATDQNHNNGHDSAGESSIDTEKGYYYHSIKLSGTPATGSDGPQARGWKGAGAGGAMADWTDINLDTAYTCADADIPTISPSNTAEGDIGEGDRDFFRVDVSGVSTVDVVLAEGKEYAWLYVRKDAPVTASAIPGVKSNYVADVSNTDAIIGLDVSTTNYLYVMVDNCKGDVEFQDNYWVGGRSETHHWVVGIGPGPCVKLNNPNGNETLIAGSSYIIEWEAVDVYNTSNSSALNINITYSTNSGLSYDYPIATNEANDGSYTWYIPNIESTNIRIKVTADDGTKNRNDTSDDDFTIKPPDPLNEIVSGTGAFSGDWFGYSVSNLGDVNGDGYNDTVVGAPYNDNNGADAGAAYIFFGRTTWSPGNLDAANADVKIYGTNANDHFGWSVSSAGNVNGDAYNDIIIGAPGNTTTVAGSAYIFYGRGAWNPSYNANNADVILNGGSNGDRFGFSVSCAGNVNNADNDDIIVGAPYNDSADGKWVDCGAAYIFYGDSGLTGTIGVTSADVNLTGATIFDYFGFSVSGAGNVNGDSYDDVVVGAPGADTAYIFYGSSTMENDFAVLRLVTYNYVGVTTAGPHDAYACDVDVFPFAGDAANRNTMVEATNAQYTAISASDNSRWTTVDPGALDQIFMWFEINSITQSPASITQIDFTFEGYSAVASDMKIYVMKAGAAWEQSASWTQVGATVNFPAGADSTMTRSLTSDFSTYISATGKLVWGVYQVVSTEALNVDHVKLDIKTECKANITLTGESTTNFGFSVSNLGDVNSDGYDDIVVGAPKYNNDQGRAYIFYGNTVMTTEPYVSETIFSEDFEGDGSPTYAELGWTTEVHGGAGKFHWKLTTTPDGTDHGSWQNEVSSDLSGSGTMDDWLISPVINCSEYKKIAVEFWSSYKDYTDKTEYGALNISIDGGTSWAYNILLYQSDGTTSVTTETKTVDISNYVAGESNVKLRWRYVANYDYWWEVDDVVITGKKPSSTTFITGEMPLDKFSYSVAWAGDINNDGINDTVVGAPCNDRTASDTGAVYVLYGNSSIMSTSMCAGAADKTNYGKSPNDNFGFSVCGLGDVNNDKYDDVIAGAPGYSSNTGKAYIYSTQGGAPPDTEKPQISGVNDSPDPQETGGYVNITAVVTDNVGLSSVKVNISGPAGFTPVNNSMTKIPSTNTYYYNTSYSVLGTYTYFIWATDASSNENASITHTFVIQDTTKPEITNAQDTPDPQEVNGWVNITVTVTDAMLDKVKVNISGPAGFTPVNATMTKISGTDNYYYNTTYTVKGTYSYFIWANDTSNNGNKSGSNTFTIQDTIKPVISSVQANPDLETSGGYINISAVITDNYQVGEVWLNITYPNDNYENISITLNKTGSTYYCNKTYTMLGWYNYTIWANDTSNNWNSSNVYSFNITGAADTTPPEFSNVQALPEDQVTGEYVNISGIVTDNVAVNQVYLNITYPDGSVINISITGNVTGSTYYCNQTYAPPGQYFYFIWASDGSGNANVSETKTFNITDTTPPEILSISASPTLQYVNDFVNISTEITDNYVVNEVWLNISYPNGECSNFSITQNRTGDIYYCNQTYSEKGIYTFYVWVNDTENNKNISETKTFEIDNTPPELSNIEDIPDPQNDVDGWVNITVNVTDNLQVDEVYLNITYPNGAYSNFSVTQNLTGNTYYCNQTYAQIGQYNYTIWANDSCNNQNMSVTYTFNITDTTPPLISNVQAKPVSQVKDNYVNISAVVTDNGEVSEVWLNISWNSGSSWSNFSITQNVTGNTYYCNQIYSTLDWYNYTVWANDTSNNCNISEIYSFNITGAPVTSVDTILPYWHTSSPLTINATATSDADAVELWYKNSTDNTTFSDWCLFDNDTVAPWSWSFDFPNGTGYYEFYTMGYNLTAGWENPPGTADTVCGYDNITPVSNVSAISPYWQNATSLTITATASDTGSSGLRNVTLYYYNSTDNTTFSGPWEFGTDTTPWDSISWSFDFPNGNQYYRFYSIVRDNASNEEDVPIVNDTLCGYDTTPPNNPTTCSETGGAENNTWQNSISDPNFDWSDGADSLSGVKGYYYYFGTDSLGTSATNFKSDSNYDPSAPGEGTFYLRIMTQDNASNNATWVTLFIFKYDGTPPSNPTSCTESHGVQNNTWQNSTPDPTFTWSGASDVHSGVNGYYCYWGDSPSGTGTEYTTLSSYTPTSPVAEGTWYLRVKTRDNATNNATSWVTIFVFRYDATPPPNVTLETPKNNSEQIETVTFNWTYVTDLVSGVANYTLEIYNDSALTNLTQKIVTTDNTTTYSPPVNNTYWWRVITYDNASNFNISDVWEFKFNTTISNHAPDSPLLTAPDNNTWTNDNTPLFDWNFSDPDNDESRGYNVTISNSSDFSTINYWVNKTTTSNITQHEWGSGGESSSPITDGTWYWRVKAKDTNDAWSNWSGWRIIKIDTIAPTVTIEYNNSRTYYKDADIVRIYANFTETGSGINETTVKITINTTGTDITNQAMTKTDNTHWYYDWDVPSGSEGNVNVSINAQDNATNPLSGTTYNKSKYIDNTMPDTAILTPVNGEIFWYKPIEINGNCTDALSGINKVEINITYTVNGSIVRSWITTNLADNYTWWNYTFTPDTDANYTVTVRAFDNATNMETTMPVITIIYDTNPPKTNISISAVLGTNVTDEANKSYGWYTSTVTVYLNSTDLAGVKKIYYRIDGGWLNQWVEVSDNKTTFTISEDGTHKIEYYAKDILADKDPDNHTEKKNVAWVKIDKIKPTIIIQEKFTHGRTPPFNITAMITDSTSGRDENCYQKITYTNSTGTYTKNMNGGPTTFWYVIEEETNGFDVRYNITANDTAGNTRVTENHSFTLDLSPITENDIGFSHYFGMVGQNITIYVDIYNNKSVDVNWWVNITANYGELNCNKSIIIGSRKWNSTSANYIIPSDADGKTITFTVKIYSSGEKDSETAEFEVASSFTGGKPVKSFDISLPTIFAAAIFAALLSLKSKNKRRKQS